MNKIRKSLNNVSYITRKQAAAATMIAAPLMPAFAHATDAADTIVTAVGLVAVSVGLVGAAVVLVKLGVKTYRWLASSL